VVVAASRAGGAAGFVSLEPAGFGLAGFGLAGLEVVGTGRAGSATLATGGAGICTVGFVACAVVSGGKDALILLDEAPIAVVGSVGMLWGTEPSAFGAGVRRVLRGRPEPAGGLPALGGFAILGFTPLVRHINEIRDRGAILPSA
jgi:hypothetical protein